MKEGKLASVCFFLPSGRTYTFRDCEIVSDNETVIVVRYTAMSDGHVKTVTMQKSQFVGHAVCDGATCQGE